MVEWIRNFHIDEKIKTIDTAQWHDQIQCSPLNDIRRATEEFADRQFVDIIIGRSAMALLMNNHDTQATIGKFFPGAVLSSRPMDAKSMLMDLISLLTGVDAVSIGPGNEVVIYVSNQDFP